MFTYIRAGILCLLFCPCLLFPQTFALKSQPSGLGLARHSNGVAVADYDVDGDLDVYIVATAQYDEADENTWNRLFQNQGDGTFTDVARQAGVLSTLQHQENGSMGNKFGAAWGDYDNDGAPDLFLTNLGPDELYRNNGDGTFTDVTGQAGVAGRADDHNTSAVWWDYDLDGDLDLYVSAWLGENIFYENLGDGTFRNITARSGLGDNGQTWTAIPIDANHDGLPDIYVVNDYGANKFYVNQGNGGFREATQEFGLEDEGHGMGVDVADYNNDGFFDIYLTNISDIVPCPLFTNTGDGRFVNNARQLGVDDTGWAWGTQFFDCDHDGDQELYVVNGFKIDPGNNYFFDNLLERGNPGFLDVSETSGTDGDFEARGLVVFDYDSDGDLDLLVANWWKPPYLYENQSATGNWLKIVLQGTMSNINGVGATVHVKVGGRTLHRANDGVDFLGQSITPVHFGIGQFREVDEIKVKWPSGTEDILTDVAANRIVHITEGGGEVTQVEEAPATEVDFKLIGNYPNPFNGVTTVEFALPKSGLVEFTVRDVLGREVYRLNRRFAAGQHRIKWGGENTSAQPVSSGFYLYTVAFGDRVHAGKLVYLK